MPSKQETVQGTRLRTRLRRWLTESSRHILWMTRNRLRTRHRDLDYIIFPLQGAYPEIPSSPTIEPLPYPLHRLLPMFFPFLFPRELSLWNLRRILRAIGEDHRVTGVIFPFGALRANPATLYSMRRMFSRLREQGKHLVAWLPTGGTWDYYLASACDEIFLSPAGSLNVLGLRAETLFLRDTLALVGVQADFEALGEYKTTPDIFSANAMTAPHREMLNAILDSTFDELVTAIAEGRGLTPHRVRALIDEMPIPAEEAVAAGLVDSVGYQDELAEHLHRRLSEADPDPAAHPAWLTWQEAQRKVLLPRRCSPIPIIGLVSIEGMIVPGRSHRMPTPYLVPLPFVHLFEVQTGAETIIQALRNAAITAEIAAVILYVNSPGGSALASDLIWREVYRLREQKPVIALMGAQAASGGYYVAAPAQRIIARPTTLTGSIGIWGGKLCLQDLYDRLGVGREVIQRGAMAGLYSELAPFTDEERERMRREIAVGYARFKERVAVGRGMDLEQVEAVARGRVWTGAQAQAVGLVDELGDMETALRAACSLAHLDPEREHRLRIVEPAQHWLLPSPISPEGADGSSLRRRKAWHRYVYGGQWSRWMAVRGLGLFHNLAGERMWALAPWVSIL